MTSVLGPPRRLTASDSVLGAQRSVEEQLLHQVGMVENKQEGWVSVGCWERKRPVGCPRKHGTLGLEFWRA